MAQSKIVLPVDEPREPKPDPFNGCTHGVTFDGAAARGMSASEVRKRWPRHFGPCPLRCGFNGIGYASWEHYIMGDW